ncbi:MAG: hypothetical protein Q9168_002110 [Polycauliona sp. 1 TL-2023]
MRSRCLACLSHLSILISLLFALAAYSAPAPAPAPPQQHSAIQLPYISKPRTDNTVVGLHKRDGLRRHVLANGWVIHYEVISVIYPIVSSLLDLRHFYTGILSDVARSSAAGGLTGPVMRYDLGKVALEFRAERGYSASVGWDIVTAFTEQVLRGELPMTFTCHIAPPGSDVGIQVELSVLV